MKALDILNDLSLMLSYDEEKTQECIVKGYIAIRLSPLEGVVGISENRINNMADFLYTLYSKHEYSIDIVINAIYNYINFTKCCPSDKLLTDDIEILLDDYAD